MDILYGQSTFVVLKNNFISRIPGGGFSLVRHYYLWFIVGYVAVIFLNIFGIGRWFTALLLFVMLDLLQKMNMSFINGGDKMARMILLYLIVADSYQYFVWVKQKNVDGEKRRWLNLLSNLAAFSIMLQLCVAYFSSGLSKIMEPMWRHGEATYYALLMERFMGTPFNKYISQYALFDKASNYAALGFELLFPVLVWVRKLRKPFLAAGILFHLCIYIFLMIYAFQIVFVLIYGLFLSNQQWLDFVQTGKTIFGRKNKDLTMSTF
jgi:hypothetical protein